jgi:predicted transcriptional regulator
MSEETHGQRPNFIEATGDIVSAYVSHNHVASVDLPALIASVHQALTSLATGQVAVVVDTVEKPSAAQVRKSVQHDGIVSFLDGRSYKTLKRHLATYGQTPATYRERFGLGADYPMVAPSYSEKRSNLAKSLGLGVPGSKAGRTAGAAPTSRRQAA